MSQGVNGRRSSTQNNRALALIDLTGSPKGSIRPGPCRGLITRRSRVRIPPPLPHERPGDPGLSSYVGCLVAAEGEHHSGSSPSSPPQGRSFVRGRATRGLAPGWTVNMPTVERSPGQSRTDQSDSEPIWTLVHRWIEPHRREILDTAGVAFMIMGIVGIVAAALDHHIGTHLVRSELVDAGSVFVAAGGILIGLAGSERSK